MIPKVDNTRPFDAQVSAYAKALRRSAYQGGISTAAADLLTRATDNSIYELTPTLLLTPKDHSDIETILSLAKHFPDVSFTARGGGTGTDGQSLNTGVVVDCSRHMTKILEIDIENKWVRIQPGVILDDLNAKLKPYGLHFPISISTGNRATLGGMLATDACGKGSLIHGRTSDHIAACKVVMQNGDTFIANSRTRAKLHQHHEAITKLVENTIDMHADEINARYPTMPRCATGYNLKKIYDKNTDTFHLPYLIAGAEGTLGIVSEITLKLTSIMRHKKLMLIHYDSFDAALRDAKHLITIKPAAIEVMDETLTDLIRQDALYPRIAHVIQENTKTITLLELAHHNAKHLHENFERTSEILSSPLIEITDPIVENTLWQCRKNSVGLLGKSDSYKRPVPFIEDATVHPEQLADYIQEFKAILDKEGLHYGMFGHADSGCIHVRPSLDLLKESDVAQLNRLSRTIFELTQRYGGILWGEHGLGFRSEYNPDFYGDTLYGEFKKIKSLFDPANQFNPGKVATPLKHENTLYNIDGPKKADRDRQILPGLSNAFAKSLHCNGNGLCFNYKTSDLMCPSYKATGDRAHSPKGRVTLLRNWLFGLSEKGHDINKKPNTFILMRILNRVTRKTDLSYDVFQAMNGCLGCKGCQTRCPIEVSIPELKLRFLEQYYARYTRPIKDFAISNMESFSRLASKTPRTWNALLKIINPLIGLRDTPALSVNKTKRQLAGAFTRLDKLANATQGKHVVLLQDVLSSFYQSELMMTLKQLMDALGYTLHILPFKPTGKPKHVLGFRKQFEKIAHQNIKTLLSLKKLGHPIIGIDPSIALVYRDEYARITDQALPKVLLLQEWLATCELEPGTMGSASSSTYHLMAHCTEVDLTKAWQIAFKRFGLTLDTLQTGCCGMAGSFGLEKAHFAVSQKLFNLSWREHIATYAHDRLLATGLSCHSQVKRFTGVQLKHPIQVLLSHLGA